MDYKKQIDIEKPLKLNEIQKSLFISVEAGKKIIFGYKRRRIIKWESKY